MNEKNTNRSSLLSRPLLAVPLAMFCCLLWGSAFPCVKIGYPLFSVDTSFVPNIWLYAGTRFTLAGVLVVIFMSALNRRLLIPRSVSSFKHVVILSVFQTSLQYALYYIGLANIMGIKASILNGTGVIILLVVSAFIFRQEKLTARKVMASLIGLTGILLMNFGGTYSSFSFMGDGLILLSILSASISTCFIKRFSSVDNPVMLSGWQFIVGGLTLVVLALLTGGSIQPTGASAYLMMLYLAFVSAAAYSIWSILLKHNPISRIAMCRFMIPVFGVILSALILGESITVMCLVALALVAASIIISNR